MATLKDKMYDLLREVRTHLNDAILYADGTGKYPDFELAMQRVHIAEAKLKIVRAQVRTTMRKTKPAFQAACPHANKVDVQIRHIAGVRTVETQACSACSKTFDLREQVGHE